MKKKLAGLLLAMFAVSLLLCGCGANGSLRIGTAGLGGTYHQFGTAFAQLTADKEDTTLEVKNTAGSAANLRLLNEGYLDLAIAQADIAADAYNGTGAFEEKGKTRGYSAIAGLYSEYCQIIVKADSDIQTVDDLQNKTVSVGEEDSGSEQNAKQILLAYGLSDKLVNEVHLNYTEAAQKLQSGEIDAFFVTIGLHASSIEELADRCEIRLLEIDDAHAKKLCKTYDYYTTCEVPKGTYMIQDKVQTVGVKSVLLAKDTLSKDQVQKLTALLFSEKESLQYSVAGNLELTEKAAVDGISIPLHAGAAAYYEAQGIAVDEAA